MSKIILTAQSGFTWEVKDHTQYFLDNGGPKDVHHYYDVIIEAACSKRYAGSMENIAKLEISTDDKIPLKILVINGKRVGF